MVPAPPRRSAGPALLPRIKRSASPIHLADEPHPGLPQRPWLSPALRLIWRSVGVLQVGTDPDTAIVIEGVDPPLYDLVRSLNGRRSAAELIERAEGKGVSPGKAGKLIQHLFSAGCLVDLDAHVPTETGTRTRRPEDNRQLLPDLAARSLAVPASTPSQIAARRARASVVIHGSRRVGSVLASLLAASGLGRVSNIDHGTVDPADVIPGGPGLADIGSVRQDAVAAAVDRYSTATASGAPDSLSVPDLVVITDPWPAADDRERVLRSLGSPYLFAAVRERRVVVGPFVIPFETSCLRCQHLHRCDRDRQWDAVVTQLRALPTRPVDAGESPLAMLAASLAAIQALHWIDGECRPASCDATLELRSPDLDIQRRVWAVHPRCECAAGRPAYPASTR